MFEDKKYFVCGRNLQTDMHEYMQITAKCRQQAKDIFLENNPGYVVQKIEEVGSFRMSCIKGYY